VDALDDGIRIPVRWRDTDALGHVNNAVYLTYLAEGCRARLGGEVDFVRVAIDYRREIAWEEREVVVTLDVRRREGERVELVAQIATAAGDLAAEAEAVVELQP
jgi:acyl-CoA thioester hydrolase